MSSDKTFSHHASSQMKERSGCMVNGGHQNKYMNFTREDKLSYDILNYCSMLHDLLYLHSKLSKYL